MSLVPTEPRLAPCTAEEARELTDRIQSTHAALWTLIAEAHDRKAWRALGYGTFQSYVEEELGMSKARAYQRLDQARVIAAISSETSTDVDVSEAAARDLKPHLSLLQTNVAAAAAAASDEDRTAAVEDAVAATRAAVRPPAPSPPPPPAPHHGGTAPTPRRKPLSDQLISAGWDLEKSVERLERLVADDRFAKHEDQAATRLRAHLARAVEVCQDLLDRLATDQGDAQ